jgi:hypothetical protein
VDGELPREIQFVDDEISPFRTTGGASFEDTATGTSGGGGVDLLLGDRDGSLLIGEIKAPGDSTLFLALIQSLTYALELTTASQMLRLKTCYPNAYAGLQSHDEGQGCRCDILLIYREGDNPKLLDQSPALARQLLKRSWKRHRAESPSVRFRHRVIARRGRSGHALRVFDRWYRGTRFRQIVMRSRDCPPLAVAVALDIPEELLEAIRVDRVNGHDWRFRECVT